MPDTSYQPLVYRKQGGDELVVASGGKITVESGGLISGIGMAVGNAYYVIPTNKAYYTDFMTNQRVYSDGSSMIYPDPLDCTGILAAIVACKGSRNDYIFVMPGAYTQAVAISLVGKSGVHLIAVNGQGRDVGATDSVSVTYLNHTGAYENFILSANSELAGFLISNATGYSAITVPASILATNIHHNHFAMVQGAAINIIDCTASVSNKRGRIHHNRFYTEVAGNLTAAINCAGGYAQDVCDNEISFANTGTIDYGIFNDSTGGITARNIVSEGNATVTNAIAINANGCAIDNRCAVVAGRGLAGGTASRSFVNNRDGAGGGATPIET